MPHQTNLDVAIIGDGADVPRHETVTEEAVQPRHTLHVEDGAVRASELGKVNVGGSPLVVLDPGLMNTATCRSGITYLDGEKGVLEHRGIPIQVLAERSTFLDVAHLLLRGTLPAAGQVHDWSAQVMDCARLPAHVQPLLEALPRTAHHMTMVMTAVASLPAATPEALDLHVPEVRETHALRLLGVMPTIAAAAYRHSRGLPAPEPDSSLGFAANFLAMLDEPGGHTPSVQPQLARALDVMLILHADHEQNCSTNAVRAVGSSQVDPYSCVAAGLAALFGPLHGGANEAVVRMLRRIGSPEHVPPFIEGVKSGRQRLMGFGHRVYKSYDPRARIIKAAADDVFAVTGVNPLLETALELERIALQDDYFVSRRLYPNVDFYSGLIYEALRLPPSMFPVLFAVARTSGWMAQWLEMWADPETRITRPRQVYTGPREVPFPSS